MINNPGFSNTKVLHQPVAGGGRTRTLQNMVTPNVRIIVCGRFHYHKYLHLLAATGVLDKFIYSYKTGFSFGIGQQYLKNFPLKEYLMYAGKRFLKGRFFDRYLMVLHHLWQEQVSRYSPAGNVVHFLVHGNCSRAIKRYRRLGIKVIGEVVNAHPEVQYNLLSREYQKFGLTYSSGEKRFEKKILAEYALCDYLLAPSAFVKKSLTDKGIDANKIKVIPYGIDIQKALLQKSSAIQSAQPIKLICISQVTFRKGIVYLFEAIELLRQAGHVCELTLVGSVDPLYQPIIQPYLSQPGVRYIHHVDNAEVPRLLMDHHLFIMPSIEDGFGIVVSEALSVHLPVVVTTNCGSAEVVTDGENGFVIDPFSATAIAEAVAKSVNYPFLFTDDVFTWAGYVTELQSFYTSILN